MALTHEQVTQLLRPINPRRVEKRDNLSHLQAYDVRAHLTRIFGFGNWSGEVIDTTMLYEDVFHGEKPAKGGGTYTAHTVSVGYRCTYRLTVPTSDTWLHSAVYTEAAAGDATNFPVNKRGDAHDFAIKTAESQAMKRCAMNLGDQFGLSLYNNGSTAALIGKTLVMPDALTEDEKPADVTEHITEQLATEAPPTPPAAPPLTPVKQRADATLPLPGPEHDIRDRALAVADSNSNAQVKKAALMKLLLEASTAQLKDAQVTGPNGHGVSLEALIHAEIANARARAS
jgi:Rad52/22 family double-strand break repair protein